MKPALQDIDRFYARQRREILERIGQRRRTRRTWVVLAAAAVLALGAMGVALQSFRSPAPDTLRLESILSQTSLPLQAYGRWDEEEMLDDSGTKLGSVEWLLDDDAVTADTDAYPTFLEPFGKWKDVEQTTPVSST